VRCLVYCKAKNTFAYDRRVVTETPVQRPARAWLRAVYKRLVDPWASPHPSAVPRDPTQEGLPDRIGHYAITRRLGAGGMGVVYEARGERLVRPGAL